MYYTAIVNYFLCLHMNSSHSYKDVAGDVLVYL